MRRSVAVLLLAACASSGSKEHTSAPRVLTCNLGGFVSATPRVVDGYPARVARLTPAEIAKRRDELERRVPGWDLTLNRDGFIESAVSDRVGPWERPAGADKLARVTAFVRALHGELGVPADATAEVVEKLPDAIHVGPEIWVKQQNAGYVTRRSVSGPERVKLRSVTGATTLQVSILHPRTASLPTLPAELTDDELAAMWSIDEARELRVTVFYGGMPCDPVGPDDCKISVPQPSVTCHRIRSLPLRRDSLEYDGVLRRIAAFVVPEGGMGSITVEGNVPRCFDAITGEDLSSRGLCRP